MQCPKSWKYQAPYPYPVGTTVQSTASIGRNMESTNRHCCVITPTFHLMQKCMMRSTLHVLVFSKDRESILEEHCGQYSCGYLYTCQFQQRYSKGWCCILNAQPLWKVHITLCYSAYNSWEIRSVPFFSWQLKNNIKGPLVKLVITMKQDTLVQCFPKLFACRPLLALKNNHRSPHPCSCKFTMTGWQIYSVWMTDFQN
jgi:hypothetical protein